MTATIVAGRAAWRRPAAGLLIAALALVLSGFGASAQGDPVPMPRLRPQYSPSASAEAEPAPAPEKKRPAVQVQVSANSPFTPSQQVALANISAYFNSFRTMEGEFIQFGPNGEQSEGVFFIARPGKIRFHYRPPVKLDVIADGRTVAIRDSKARTQDMYPLSKTPLRYLLAEQIDLTSANVVRKVTEERDLISLVIVETGAFAEGQLTLIFDRTNFELKQWIVTDAQGLNTSVAIYNTQTGKSPDPALFRINVN